MNTGCFMDESYEVETKREDRMLYKGSLSLALQHGIGKRDLHTGRSSRQHNTQAVAPAYAHSSDELEGTRTKK